VEEQATRERWHWRPARALVAVLLTYFALPIGTRTTAGAVIGFVLTTIGLTVLAAVLWQEVRRLRQGRLSRSYEALTVMVIVAVVAFALAFFLLDQARPDEMVGMSTRLDALYFTIVTMATVGFGDVHAAGQFARGLVSALIFFDVVVIASLANAIPYRHR
jgi:hypothetical protein